MNAYSVQCTMNEGQDEEGIDHDELDEEMTGDPELCEWLENNKFNDLKQALISREYTLSDFKNLSRKDIDAIVDDIKQEGGYKIHRLYKLKASLNKLHSVPNQSTTASPSPNVCAAIEEKQQSPNISTQLPKQRSKTLDALQLCDTTQKIVIIGHSRVGKSSLKDVITGQTFDPNHFPTIRMKQEPEIYQSVAKARSQSEHDVNIGYELWDTPGQDKLREIAQLYINGVMAILIVYDISDEATWIRAKEWMIHVRDNAKGYDKVAVIGNKKDLASERKIQFEEAHDECIELGYFYLETSAKSGKGIASLQKWLDSQSTKKLEVQQMLQSKNNQPEFINLEQKISEKQKKRRCCKF